MKCADILSRVRYVSEMVHITTLAIYNLIYFDSVI